LYPRVLSISWVSFSVGPTWRGRKVSRGVKTEVEAGRNDLEGGRGWGWVAVVERAGSVARGLKRGAEVAIARARRGAYMRGARREMLTSIVGAGERGGSGRKRREWCDR
jgi:hypothetical protein